MLAENLNTNESLDAENTEQDVLDAAEDAINAAVSLTADADQVDAEDLTTDDVETTGSEEPTEGEFEELAESSSSADDDIHDPNAPNWYVLHTYSGYENKVKRTIEQIVQNRNLQDHIFEVEVPEEDVVEVKDGKKKTVTRKVFPGYVLIKMRMGDDIWYIVRNVQGVTGFVGPESKPVPLRNEELAMMGVETDWVPEVDYEIGDSVRIINGPLESFIGLVEEINFEKKKVKLSVSMFGRETPVELDFTQVMSY